jgi:predicted AAA+ superfamily ATPase
MNVESLFEEWNELALRRRLVPRDIDMDGLAARSNNMILAISGLRRSGKSSTMMLLSQHLTRQGTKALYVNMEDPRLRSIEGVWDHLTSWFGEDEGFLLLDEVSAMPGWGGWLAKAHELYKDLMHIVVTSSRPGLDLPPKELRGRIIRKDSFPLSFKEHLRFSGVKEGRTSTDRARMQAELQRYLRWGGFPAVVLEKDETLKTEMLGSYYENIIGLDLAGSVRYELAEVERIARYLLASPYFSAGKCLSYLTSVGFGTSKAKLLDLEREAEASSLFHFSHIFSYNVKDAGQYPRKCRCGDNGLFQAVLGEVGAGREWENAAFLALRKEKRLLEEVSYWKDHQGREVDLVLRDGPKVLLAVQVCSDLGDERVARRELDSLVRCAKELKAERAVIVSPSDDGVVMRDDVLVEAVPMLDWMLKGPEASMQDVGEYEWKAPELRKRRGRSFDKL